MIYKIYFMKQPYKSFHALCLAINIDIYNFKFSFVLKVGSFFHLDSELLI